MPQTILTSTELTNWLQKETGSTLTPVQAQAQRYRDETRIALQNLTEASKLLLDSSQKEIDKRNNKVFNRARALNKLASLFLDRLKKLRIPEQITYDNFTTFAAEIQKTFTVFEVDVRNWFPRISPFFIMDRRKFLTVFEKSKLTISALTEFVAKEYVKTKTLEKTFELTSDLQALEAQALEVKAVMDALRSERLQIEKELSAVEARISQFKSQAAIEQLAQLDAEQDALNNELKQVLRHLQKPLLKMQAVAIGGGGGGITPDELKMIGLYMDNPFEAFSTEPVDFPVFKSILEKMSSMLDADKLKLKPDKQRKAEQAVAEFLKTDVLSVLHAKCVEVATRKKLLLESAQLEEAKRNLTAFEQQTEPLKARKSNLESDEKVKENQLQDLQSKMVNLKKAIQTNITESTGKQIQIQ